MRNDLKRLETNMAMKYRKGKYWFTQGIIFYVEMSSRFR